MVMKEEPTNCAAVRNIGQSTKERERELEPAKTYKKEKEVREIKMEEV